MFLIALVVLQVFISALVPQRDIAAGQIIGWRNAFGPDNPVITSLWLDRIYYSPVFIVSLALLGLNLLVGNVRRFRMIWRVEKKLLRARHLGSTIFHLALLVIIAGVVLNNLFRFDGVYGVTEGQQVRDLTADYMQVNKGLLRGDVSGRFHLVLASIDRFHEVGDAVTEEAQVRLTPAAGGLVRAGGVRINRPLSWQDLEIHLGGATGYSPEVVVLDDAGRSRFRGFVRLKVAGKGESVVHEDFVLLDQGELSIKVRIIPDPEHPARFGRRLTVARQDSILFSGGVAAADTVVAGDLRIMIPRIRNWCYLRVISNPLLWLVFTGFWTALAGMAISVVARVVSGRAQQT